jgi:hypothetical protein
MTSIIEMELFGFNRKCHIFVAQQTRKDHKTDLVGNFSIYNKNIFRLIAALGLSHAC